MRDRPNHCAVGAVAQMSAPGRGSGISLLHDGKISHRMPGRLRETRYFHLFGEDERQVGGARRDRTDDLKLAKLALSQLSYGPIRFLAVARHKGALRSVVFPDIQHTAFSSGGPG